MGETSKNHEVFLDTMEFSEIQMDRKNTANNLDPSLSFIPELVEFQSNAQSSQK